jgi:hypothetical protein
MKFLECEFKIFGETVNGQKFFKRGKTAYIQQRFQIMDSF